MQVVVKLVVGRPGMWPDRQPGASGPNGHRLGLGAERELTGVSGPWEGVNSRPGLRIVPSPAPPALDTAGCGLQPGRTGDRPPYRTASKTGTILSEDFGSNTSFKKIRS